MDSSIIKIEPEHDVVDRSARLETRPFSAQTSLYERHPPLISSLTQDYLQTVLRHRLLIGCLALTGLLGAVLLHLTTQPVYRSRTSLDIQGLNGDFLNIRSVDPTALITSAESNIQTQIKLLQSDSLTERVKERLTQEEHPASVKRTDLLSSFLTLLHVTKPSEILFASILDETAKGVKVKPLGISRLVEVSCDSWDATFAAKYCNTLVNEFQAEDLESRGAQAKQTSDWLMHQAGDIRQKAEESQRQLFLATGGNGLILSQGVNSVGEDRLRQMQTELVKAQADRMEKQAQKSIALDKDPDAVPSVVDSPAYAASRAKLAELQNQVAALMPPLTEANPKIIHLRSEIAQVKETMASAQTESNHKLDNEYAAAKHREDLLALAFRAEEANVSSDLEKGSQVSLLRREVESEQQLYQTLLQRAKEAGFASAMRATTIRAVDEAQKTHFPVYPQRGTTALLGLMLGTLVGTLVAFYKERNMAVFHAPGESQDILHVSEIGVIPSTPRHRGRMAAKTSRTATDEDAVQAYGDPALQTVCWTDSFSLAAEAYRSATLSIMLSSRNGTQSTYIISSPSSNEGKTTVTANLGIALSKARLRVALIEGDLRRPSLHKALFVSKGVGIREILGGEISAADAPISTFCKPTAFPRLHVISSGDGDEEPTELLHSAHLQTLLNRLRKEFDVILIDTPPMLHMADARVLARNVDGAILILRSAVTTREEALNARNLFAHDQVPILGTILNDFNPSRTGKFGYYDSYYAYQGKDVGMQAEARS